MACIHVFRHEPKIMETKEIALISFPTFFKRFTLKVLHVHLYLFIMLLTFVLLIIFLYKYFEANQVSLGKQVARSQIRCIFVIYFLLP